MSPYRDRTLLRLVLIGALAASLGLAACGRKGPLDPPPGASLEGVAQPNPAPGLISTNRNPKPIGGQVKDDNPGVDENGHVVAPKGPKKTIPLDVLLN